MSTDGSSAIEQTAADWLARRDSGDWSAGDRAAFEQWLNTSTLHRVTYLRIEDAWEQALRLKALGAGVSSQGVPPRGQWVLSPFIPASTAAARRIGSRHWLSGTVALAASVLLALTAWLIWPSAVSTYHTPVGGVASLPLADGSKITLNTNSRVRVAVTDTERRVEVDHGEAFFEVAPDPLRPFVVNAGNKRVVVVGTRFSVRREPDAVRVAVTEGKVRVETSGSEQTTSHELLPAGTVALADAEGIVVRHRPVAEVEEILSWRSGVLILRDMTLAEAAAEFNRYNTRKILIEDPALAALPVAGRFGSTQLQPFVRLLEQGYPLRAEYRDDSILLRSR